MNLKRIAVAIVAVTCIALTAPSEARAQRTDSIKAVAPAVTKPSPTPATDSLLRRVPQVTRARVVGPPKPPLSTRRAFIYSLLLPGLGQSKLDRGSAGAFFAAIELGSLAMIQKTRTDLRDAKRFSGDTLASNYAIGADGKIAPFGIFPNHFPTELVSTRRLHVEDWFAALAFNHLISGADAFVAAQLWDVPKNIAIVPTSNGMALTATLHW